MDNDLTPTIELLEKSLEFIHAVKRRYQGAEKISIADQAVIYRLASDVMATALWVQAEARVELQRHAASQ